MSKKQIFSGVQPSGNLHLGNYLGAIKQWVEMQKIYNCIFCVVDYHAITVPQNPEILKEKIIEITKIYLASGIDPNKSIIFQQSMISAHTELAWILNATVTRMSDLYKMTQFKDKSSKSKEENAGLGLFDYPVLMASDILLYNTEIVPVGEDQVQHVELARVLARRFNHQFGETFVVPKAVIKKTGARIMGLDNPEKKMSKSASSELNYIALLDKPEEARKKIMKATTDSETSVKYDQEKKPGISNLLEIYSLLADLPIDEIIKKHKNSMYGDFKKDLALVVCDFLTQFQERFDKISNEQAEKILLEGKAKAEIKALEVLGRVKKRIGVL